MNNSNKEIKVGEHMDIKELNQELHRYLDKSKFIETENGTVGGDIEWAYDPICNIEPILQELNQNEIKHWKEQVDIDKAIEKLHEYYKQKKVSVGFPTNTGFNYKGTTYHLALVFGNNARVGGKLTCKYGYRHIFDKHGKETHIIDGGTLATEEALKDAISKIETAIDEGTPFISKKEPDKLAILHGQFLYIICFSNHPQYVTYLHNLFPLKKGYLKRGFKSTYKRTSPVKTVKIAKDDSEKSS